MSSAHTIHPDMVGVMKRVHYGNLTIDVSNYVADGVLELSRLAATREHYRMETTQSGNSFGFRPVAYAHGSIEQVQFTGYVNGDSKAERVTLLVGIGYPIAVSGTDVGLDDPETSNADVTALIKQIQEYETGSEDDD